MPDTGYNKAIGATVGVGVGGAAAHLMSVFFFPHADPSVAIDLATLLNAALAFGGAYLLPHKNGGS